MRTERLKFFAASLVIILSLVASMPAACGCSHHQEKVEVESPSCHQNSHQAKTESHQPNDSSETVQTLICETDCCCASPAPKAYAKSETVKIEKQNLAIASSPLPIETIFVSQTISVKAEFFPSFRLTDSSYNIKSPRAPPRS